jgi:hypothetical protein
MAADNAASLAIPSGNACAADTRHDRSGVPRWLWLSGRQSDGTALWTEYGLELSATIEEAFTSGLEAAFVDTERLVKFESMRQERHDAPHRSRAVRREPPPVARAPATEQMNIVDLVAHSDARGRDRGAVPASGKRPRSADPAEEQQRPASGVKTEASPPVAWRFTRLHPNWRLPPSVNEGAVQLSDLLSASELEGASEVFGRPHRNWVYGALLTAFVCSTSSPLSARYFFLPPRFALSPVIQVHLHNYMIDLDWIFETCPALDAFLLRGGGMLKVFHGEKMLTGAAKAIEASTPQTRKAHPQAPPSPLAVRPPARRPFVLYASSSAACAVFSITCRCDAALKTCRYAQHLARTPAPMILYAPATT